MTYAEAWLPVDGLEGRYEVSDLGRVRSLPRLSPRWHKDGRAGRILKPIYGTQVYGHVRLYNGDGSYRHVAVHVLVAETFIGPCPPGMECRHLDGNPLNNAAVNLAWGTRSENMRDKARHGTDHNLNKTHCAHGHEYTEANTYIRKGGKRRCRQCAREWARDKRRAEA